MNVTWVTIPGACEQDEFDPTLYIGTVPFGTFAGLMASPGHTVYIAWDTALKPGEVDAYEWRVEISESCADRWHTPDNPLPPGVSDEGIGRSPSVSEAKAAALARWSPFPTVSVDNGVTLDYVDDPGDFTKQHCAFLVSDDEFDAAYMRLIDDRLPIWADPHLEVPGEINHRYGGRGVYFQDPDGHLLEIMTTPYAPEPS